MASTALPDNPPGAAIHPFENLEDAYRAVQLLERQIGFNRREIAEQVDETPAGSIGGLVTTRDAGDTSHDINVTAGSCRDSGNNITLVLPTERTKKIDVDWVYGNDQGGFPSGLSLTADTWYHVFLIATKEGLVDIGFDTSLTASNLLTDASDYAYYRRIGSFLTDGSSNITSFRCVETAGGGLKYTWGAGVSERSSAAAHPDADIAITVPSGIVVRPITCVFQQHGTAGDVFTYIGDAGAGAQLYMCRTSLAGQYVWATNAGSHHTDTSRNIRLNVTISSGTLTGHTLLTAGWFDDRRS